MCKPLLSNNRRHHSVHVYKVFEALGLQTYKYEAAELVFIDNRNKYRWGPAWGSTLTLLFYSKIGSCGMIALFSNCIITRRMKAIVGLMDGLTSVLKHKDTFTNVMWWRVERVERWVDVGVTGGGRHGCWFVLSNQWACVEVSWRSMWSPLLSSPTSTMLLWSFLTIDSSLNNHYSNRTWSVWTPLGC